MTKHIFVTGGVVSSLGKGLTSASIGLLLERRGLAVRHQKLDPYINIDPGMLSPLQHGETYILDDGTETDLDLGHYERFTSSPLSRASSWTTGLIYLRVIEKERRGEFNGGTVQVIPHVTNEIKSLIRNLDKNEVDVVITEIGGTVGDIESLPFLEAIRQYSLDVGKKNCLFVHLTLVPYLKSAREIKTKPTQHSVEKLRQIGIQPDILICRTEHTISNEEKEKIALFCNLERESVIEEKDRDFSIYEVPISLHEHQLDRIIVEKLGLTQTQPIQLDDWRAMLQTLRHPEHEVTIAVVGEYTPLRDAYKSIYESLDHGGLANQASVRIVRIQSETLDDEEVRQELRRASGILVAGGVGERGIDGKLSTIRIARENGIPFLGICMGMQCALIEFARNVIGLDGAHSTEFDKETRHPIICLPDEQKSLSPTKAKMRIGAQGVILAEGSRARECYQKETIFERHRHRYEFSSDYRDRFAAAGMLVSGTSPDGQLCEVIEIPAHPWFVAVQFHPEFKSQPTRPHPLFANFIAASVKK